MLVSLLLLLLLPLLLLLFVPMTYMLLMLRLLLLLLKTDSNCCTYSNCKRIFHLTSPHRRLLFLRKLDGFPVIRENEEEATEEVSGTLDLEEINRMAEDSDEDDDEATR